MAYSKNTWRDGDIITADKINNIEEGLNNIDDKAVTSVTVGGTQYLPTGGSVQIPAYPSKVSDLQNDRGFITRADLPEPPTIPTKVSELENDSDFIISTELETLLTSLGYIKESRVREMINKALYG